MFLNQTTDVEGGRSISDSWDLDKVIDKDEWGNPTGTTHDLPFDKEVLLHTIMLKGGELGVVFNNIATYYAQCMWWWKKWHRVFQKWWEVEEIDYNPMWDRDGLRKFHEDIDDEGYNNNVTTGREVMDDDTTGSKTSTEVMDDDTTEQGTSTLTVDTDTTNSSTTENTVSAFDASTYQPHDKSTTSGSGTVDTTEQNSYSKSGTDDRTTTFNESTTGADDRITTTNGTSDTDLGNARDIDHLLREVGQWGISTKSAEMFALQIRTRKKYNPYDLMSDLFLKEMTDNVYL